MYFSSYPVELLTSQSISEYIRAFYLLKKKIGEYYIW